MTTSIAGPAAWVPPLLDGLLPLDVIRQIVANFEDHHDLPLGLLGVDSLAMMRIVLNIESVFGVDIDFETFDIAVLRTLGTIGAYLHQAGRA